MAIFIKKKAYDKKMLLKKSSTFISIKELKTWRAKDFISVGMSDVDILTVKGLLGHKSLNVTLRYAHPASAHKVMALEVLGSQLNNQVYFTGGA